MTPPPNSDAISTAAPFARGRPSLAESHASIAVPATGAWRRFFAFVGPGYLVAVGYMDPGNWATDLAGGSAFGYTLLAVVLLSSLMAILLQTLSARLGIAAKLDLAQACRARYGRKTTIVLWLLCEVAIQLFPMPLNSRSSTKERDVVSSKKSARSSSMSTTVRETSEEFSSNFPKLSICDA
jgi:manganese transport protein